MKISNTSERLKEYMKINNIKQIDILNKCVPICKEMNIKINRSNISQYVSGTVEPNQIKLTVLAKALNVDEVWLMGYDVPMRKKTITETTNEELDLLDAWRKLGESQKNVIMATIKAFINEEV